MKSSLTICFLTLLLMFGCASNKTSTEDIQADILYAKGTSSLLNANYTDALISLKKSNELRKDDTKTLNNLGMAYFFKSDYASAKKYFKEALDADETNHDAKSNLASIYIKEGLYDKAEQILQQITKVLTYRNQFRVYYNLAEIALTKYNEPLAIKYLKKAIAEEKYFCAGHIRLGKIYNKRRSYELAHESFLNATKGNCFNQPASHYDLAMFLLERGEYYKAKEKFKLIVESFPSSPFAKMAEKKLKKTASSMILNNNNDPLDLPQNAIKVFKKKQKRKNNNYSSSRF